MTRFVKLITFDVTETLLMFQPSVVEKYAESAKKFGIDVDCKNLISNLKVENERLSKLHPNYGQSTGLGWEKWWTHFVVNSFKLTDPKSDNKALHDLASFLIEEFTTPRCWTLADGTLEILEYLKSKNIPLGVVSNYDERLDATLRSMKIHSYFDFILTSYSAGVMKPDRKIFDLARTLIPGNFPPQHCLHIGNSIEFDYVGSKNAGWKSAHIGSVDKEVLKLVDKGEVYKSLTELKEDLEKNFNFASN